MQPNGLCVGWRASILALASTPPIRLPAPGTGPCDGQSAAASGRDLDPAAASAASCSAQPPPGLGTRFGEEHPHFPNGHRRLGLTPQVLVECQSWVREARDCHNRLGFTSGDWLVYWFSEDPRDEVRRLMHSAYEANQGWSAASWLKLWLEEADVPGPPPGQPPSGTASASASAQPSGHPGYGFGILVLALALPLVLALALSLALALAVCLWLHAQCHRLSPRFWLRPITESDKRVHHCAADLLQISLQFPVGRDTAGSAC